MTAALACWVNTSGVNDDGTVTIVIGHAAGAITTFRLPLEEACRMASAIHRAEFTHLCATDPEFQDITDADGAASDQPARGRCYRAGCREAWSARLTRWLCLQWSGTRSRLRHCGSPPHPPGPLHSTHTPPCSPPADATGNDIGTSEAVR